MAKLHYKTLETICEIIWLLEETSGLDRTTDKEVYEATLKAQLIQRGFEFTEIDLDSLFPNITETQKVLGDYKKITGAIKASRDGLEKQFNDVTEKLKNAMSEKQAVLGAQQLVAQLLVVVQECEGIPVDIHVDHELEPVATKRV